MASHNQSSMALIKQLAVNEAVDKFLQADIIELSPTQNTDFLTIQETNKRRPILDYQKINNFIQCQYFKLEGDPALRDIIEENDFICKLDLKDAYVGKIYQYKTLAFGMSVSPRVFSKLMKFAIEPTRQLGIRLVYYLDDICILDSTKTEAINHIQKVVSHLERLGFLISYQKSVPTPLQQQEFLGFVFNTKTMKISVPIKKLTKLMRRLKQAMNHQPTQYNCRWYACLMEKMTSMIPAIGEALLHLRHMQRDLATSLFHHHQNWDAPMTLSQESRKELEWWKEWINKKNGLPIQKISSCTTPQIFKIRGNSLNHITKLSSENPKYLQRLRFRLEFSTDKQTMGTTIDRRVCEQTRYSTTTILEPSARPRGASIGCFPTDMATKRNVPVPTLEIHSKNNSANKTSETKTSSSCHTVLANSVLVSNNTQDETQESTKGVQIRQVENDRMELIRNKRKTVDRLDEDTIEFLSHAHRKNTHRVYNSGWKKWITWCAAQNPIVLPEDYDVKNVLMFLKSNSHFSYQYLNGLRSSIASVFKTLHPDQVPIANQDCIIEFFKAKKHKEILIPEKHRLQTEAKEAQVKSTVLGFMDDKDLCLVSTLFDFMAKSEHLRRNLPDDHTLFLAYINDPGKVDSVSKSTVASWVQKTMTSAGIDTTKYKAHSIRSASSTKAVEKGVAIPRVKMHANWSLRSNTFEKHYLKPSAQQNDSIQLTNSIFSKSGEPTTLTSESQSTRIVEGTTNNTSIA
ncbi:hypothetical protein G6F62_008593 [Rhizopus arrhizus]|nr:hypothetical protein G6F62_008593 [Rhizopus arrhizus]